MHNFNKNAYKRSEMVSGEEILLDIYANSQNLKKKTTDMKFSTFKPKDDESVTKSVQDPKNGGVVHLTTRLISDDVPRRNYEGLKSESVIFLPNVTTFPNKRPAPVRGENSPNPNSNPDLNPNPNVLYANLPGADEQSRNKATQATVDDHQNASSYLEPKNLKIVDSNTKTSQASPPSEHPKDEKNNKIGISAFERGRLPSISKKEKQRDVLPSPEIAPKSANKDSASIFPVGTSKNIKRSNFHIGLPTILPVAQAQESSSVPHLNRDRPGFNLILRAPEKFSDSSQPIKNNLGQTLIPDVAISPERNPWTNGKDNIDVASNIFIKPFKPVEQLESFKPVEFNNSFNENENKKSETGRPPQSSGQIESKNPIAASNIKITSPHSENEIVLNQQTLTFDPEGKTLPSPAKQKDLKVVKDSERNRVAFDENGKFDADKKLKLKSLHKYVNGSRLAVNTELDFLHNSFVNNKNFRNHLEEIISKSTPTKLKPRKNFSNQPSGNKKYKFLVEGIDVPKDSKSEEREDENLSAKIEVKGFSYLKDKDVARQVVVRAAQVTARRPHESVEHLTVEREIISNSKSIDENERLRQARANLHVHLKGLKGAPSHSQGTKTDGEKQVDDIDASHGGSRLPHRLHDDEISKDGLENLNKNIEDPSKAVHDEHNIPHDTSRIFLRPHDKDAEQLMKLEEERNKSLRKKTPSIKLMSMASLNSARQNIKDVESHLINSKETNLNNETTGRRFSHTRNLSQMKIKSNMKNKTNNFYFSSQPNSDLTKNSSQVINQQSGFTGERLTVKPADEPATKRTHQSTVALSGRLLTDDDDDADGGGDNSVYSVQSVFLHSYPSKYKQKKVRHRRKSRIDLDFRFGRSFDSSEHTENESYALYRGFKHNLNKARRKEHFLVEDFYSDPEILDSSKFTIPGNVKTQIEDQLSRDPGLVSIKQRNRIISGNISVPNFRSEKKSKSITGEITVPKKSSQKRVRSRTLPVVRVIGPGVHHKIFGSQVSNFRSSTLSSANLFPNLGDFGNHNKQNTEYVYQKQANQGQRLMDSSKNFVDWSSSLAASMPALESSIVDPELKMIDQRGGQYRVQMKLNAFTLGRVSSLSGKMMEGQHQGIDQQSHVNKIERETKNFISKYFDIPTVSNTSQNPFYGHQGNSTLSVQVTSDENVLKSQINRCRENGDSYAIKSITPSLALKSPPPSTIEFDLELLRADKAMVETYSAASPMPTKPLITSTTNHASLKEKTVPGKSSIKYQNNDTTGSMLLIRDQLEPQSCAKDNILNVIRGSILIRNSMDKNTRRKYLENCEHNGTNGRQDNNLFHRKYFQNRENPMYASDFETIENVREVAKHLDVGSGWKENDAFERNVPVEKQWFYDHIWSGKPSNKNQSNRKIGAWKLKSGIRDWTDFRNLTNSSNHHVRQSIDVEKEEEELIGPLRGREAQQVQENLNVDAISERVELSLTDGIVTIEVKVRCERLVPIRGATDMFRKSAVVVTRKIEIDMTVSPDRKAVYDAAVALSRKEDSAEPLVDCLRLSAKDTFELYCKLMEIADDTSESKEGLLFGSVHIDKELEEDARVPYGATSPEVFITDEDFTAARTFPRKQKTHPI